MTGKFIQMLFIAILYYTPIVGAFNVITQPVGSFLMPYKKKSQTFSHCTQLLKNLKFFVNRAALAINYISCHRKRYKKFWEDLTKIIFIVFSGRNLSKNFEIFIKTYASDARSLTLGAFGPKKWDHPQPRRKKLGDDTQKSPNSGLAQWCL